MSAMVAHEVKNPLAGISGALQVIAKRLPADSSDRAVIDDVQARIGSLNELLQDLLQFARPRVPTPSRTSIATLLREIAVAVGP